MIYSVCFTNFGPYHLARLRALAGRLARTGHGLFAYEVADEERRYPWVRNRGAEPFTWTTLFPGRTLESIPREDCIRAMTWALERDRPDALGIVGYARPESMAALNWATRHDRPTVLMSESQEIDHPRLWWKEAVKSRRVRKFSAGLVGGPRHRDYLVKLGMPRHRIALGYNAVDNHGFAQRAELARLDSSTCRGLPEAPYFLAVNRFVPEKNLTRLVRAFARYRADAPSGQAWDLVLCGDGPAADEIDAVIQSSSFEQAIHRPGFLQAEAMAPWLAHASAFVHPSLMEPWGLVVNEAAACGLPLLVSDRSGCVETLVPEPAGTTGRRFDPRDEDDLTASLAWISGLSEPDRRSMGRRRRRVRRRLGPRPVRSRDNRGPVVRGPGLRSDQDRPQLPSRPHPQGFGSPIMSGLAPTRLAPRETSTPSSTGWLHCCNGLDPRRDGGMVPSILGMTGALARRGEPITIVTPTPSRLDGTSLPAGVHLLGPETDLERSIRSAEVVHFHGLWQGHTRRGAKTARQANVPYLMAAHGMAEPWALRHKALKKKLYTALVEGKNLRRASCLHALARPEVGHLRASPPELRLRCSERRRPGSVRRSAPSVGPGSRIPRACRQVRPSLLRSVARQERARPPGRGPWGRQIRLS